MVSSHFHQLRIFRAVARLGSFSRAAEELSISQPAVSIQVRQLEKAVGSPLLHRTRSGPQLTDIGRTVFGYANRIFSLAREMDETLHDIQGLRGGQITIGCSTTPGEYILPWVIGQFRERYPDIEVSLSISNTQATLDRISSREIDLGMVGAPVSLEGLASFPYVDDEIVIVASPGHPLAGKQTVSLAELADQPFIFREPGSATRRTAETCISGHGLSVKVEMELGSNEAIKRAVAAGLGLGAVSKFGAAPDIAGGFITALPVEGWECRRPLTVVHRREKQLPPAQRVFVRFLREERPLPPASG